MSRGSAFRCQTRIPFVVSSSPQTQRMHPDVMWGRGKTKNREDDRNDVGGALLVEETTGDQGHGDVEEQGWSNKSDNG